MLPVADARPWLPYAQRSTLRLTWPAPTPCRSRFWTAWAPLPERILQWPSVPMPPH